MGFLKWSDDHYHEKAAFRASTGRKVFEYDADIRSGRTSAKVHDKMNPHGVKLRESRDSENHPESHAVSVWFDETASMRETPGIFQKWLAKLMGLLIRKGYLEHPAIMIGSFGDATYDRSPLQVGQFESGIEIEEDLSKIYLEGGGGPDITESYELPMYFNARHTSIDCFEKRGKKGYFFIIGDEIPYPMVKKTEVKRLLGDDIQSDIPIKDIIKELQVKWEVYAILPKMTHHWDDERVQSVWRDLLGQNYLKLEDPEGICELIAGVIGVNEGKTDIEDLERDLHESGTSRELARTVTGALAKTTSKGTNISVPDSGASSGISTL